MIVWTPTAFECLICMRFRFLYFTCSAQWSMFHMEKRSRNTLIIIIIIIIIVVIVIITVISGRVNHSLPYSVQSFCTQTGQYSMNRGDVK